MFQSSCIPVRFAGTGHALPATVLSSEALDDRLGLERGSLGGRSGVLTRHVCGKESQIDLAVAASLKAIDRAGIEPAEIDLLVGACGIPYQTLPSTAPLIMAQLGLEDGTAAAIDVNATCLSFLAGVELAAMRIAAGTSRVALVVSSEIASRALPWDQQPEVAALFGDGAAAAVLTAPRDPRSGICANVMRTYPSAYDACQIGAGGTRIDFHAEPEEFARHAHFSMDGKALFRLVSRHFSTFVDHVLKQAGWSRDDVDLVVPHQASPMGLAHIMRQTAIGPEHFVDITRTIGNQIAASIPTALDIAWRDGRIGPGSRLLLLGTSAGVSFGGMAIEVGA